jgi:hypothetical protein
MQDWRPGAIGLFDPVDVPRCLTSRTTRVPEGLASKGSFVAAFARGSRGHRLSVSQAGTGTADFSIRWQLPSFRFWTLVKSPLFTFNFVLSKQFSKRVYLLSTETTRHFLHIKACQF